LHSFLSLTPQSEMAFTFMEGIDPDLDRFTGRYFLQSLTKYPRIVLDALEELSDEERENLERKLQGEAQQMVRDYEEGLSVYRRRQHVNPVVQLVASLPKEQLAELAEALVSVTGMNSAFDIIRRAKHRAPEGGGIPAAGPRDPPFRPGH